MITCVRMSRTVPVQLFEFGIRVGDLVMKRYRSKLRKVVIPRHIQVTQLHAYDADATEVAVVTDAPRYSEILVRDNGNGMIAPVPCQRLDRPRASSPPTSSTVHRPGSRPGCEPSRGLLCGARSAGSNSSFVIRKAHSASVNWI